MSDDVKKSAGRPRKYVELEQITKEIVEVPVVKLNTKLPNLAIGVAKNDKGRWCVYSFNFDPQTKEVSFTEEKESFSKLGATMHFKKVAVSILR